MKVFSISYQVVAKDGYRKAEQHVYVGGETEEDAKATLTAGVKLADFDLDPLNDESPRRKGKETVEVVHIATELAGQHLILPKGVAKAAPPAPPAPVVDPAAPVAPVQTVK